MRIFGFRFRLRSRGGESSEDGFTYVLVSIFIVGLIVLAIWLAILIVVALLPFALIIAGPTILHLGCLPRLQRWEFLNSIMKRPGLALASLPVLTLILALIVLPPGVPVLSIVESPIDAYGDVLHEIAHYDEDVDVDPARWSGYLVLLSLGLATGGLVAYPLHYLFCTSLQKDSKNQRLEELVFKSRRLKELVIWKFLNQQLEQTVATSKEVEDHRSDSDVTKTPPESLPTREPGQKALTFEQKQAVRSARDHLDYEAFSRQGLINELKDEGFTAEQAIFGVDEIYGPR